MPATVEALLEALELGGRPTGAQPESALLARQWVQDSLRQATSIELAALFDGAADRGISDAQLLEWIQACCAPSPETASVYRQLAAHLPDEPDLVMAYNLGLALRSECGEPAAALRLFERCTERWPNDPDSWLELGNARGELGDQQGAVAAWARAAGLVPDDPGPWLNMGQLHKALQQWEAACEAMAECCERTDEAEAWHVYGHVLQMAGRADEGEWALRQAIDGYLDRAPDDETLYWTAAAWARLGELDEALGCLETALRGDPSLAAEARDEEDFVELRGDTRFEALIAGG